MVLLSTYKLHVSPLINLQALCVLYMGQAFQIGCRVGVVAVQGQHNTVSIFTLLKLHFVYQCTAL